MIPLQLVPALSIPGLLTTLVAAIIAMVVLRVVLGFAARIAAIAAVVVAVLWFFGALHVLPIVLFPV